MINVGVIGTGMIGQDHIRRMTSVGRAHRRITPIPDAAHANADVIKSGSRFWPTVSSRGSQATMNVVSQGTSTHPSRSAVAASISPPVANW